MTLKTITIPLGLCMASIALYSASLWWEKGLARVESSVASPDGCLRLDSVRPFWVLPSIFHSSTHDETTYFLRAWTKPLFYRLYDNLSGKQLRETAINDVEPTTDGISWDNGFPDGPRFVSVGSHRLRVEGQCSLPEHRLVARGLGVDHGEILTRELKK